MKAKTNMSDGGKHHPKKKKWSLKGSPWTRRLATTTTKKKE